MKTKKFKLSPAGKLVASLAIIFASLGAAYAADIVGAGDAAHNPTISSAANGAAVVDIVAPSASGLSHNQYDSFNVNKPGAVLNNSLTDGTSQLAGQLNANANLGSNAAKIILNEVISRNPSLLLGKQEIFGMAADYVLANPNGIACDGCGFINTNRSSLVVGNPLVEKGELNGFNTFNNTHALSIGKGGLDADSALDLIAPRISAEGHISSPEQVYALTGENRVSAKGEILESRNTQKAGALDSYYLGSMQAGRIRLISTAEGSGVKIGNEIDTFRLANGQVTVGDIDVASKGNLELEAAKLKGADIRLTGKNIVSKGKIISDSHSRNDSDNYDTWWSGKYVNNRDSSQRLQETSISGNDVSIVAKQNNTLTGAYVQGRDVTLQGANLKLDGQKLTQTDGHTDNRDRGAWRRNTNKENEKVEQVGTEVHAHRNAKLMADEGDIVISGSQVYANNDLSINAKNDLHLSGLTESQTVRENGKRKNDTSKLLTGSWSNSTTTENLKTAKLNAVTGNLGLSAGGNITSKGAEVRAKKDLIVTADKQINIDVQKTANQKTVKNDIVVWGGIGGGDDKDNGNKKEVSHASDFSSNGKLLVSGNQGVKVTGSKVTAKEGAFVETKNGGLVIDNAISLTTEKVDQRTGTVFNITKDSKKANNSTEQSTGSELKSDADLKLFSQQDTTIVGSLVNSADELGIKTLGNLNVKSAVEQQKIDEKTTSLKVDAYAKEHSDKQYRAGLRIEHTSETEKTDSTKNKAATLSGGSVKIESDKDVTFTGSKLETTKGDAKISGNNVAFLAAEDKTTSDKTSTKVGGGVYYTGGIDKAGSGVEVGYENSKTHTDANNAAASSSNVAGNFTVEAKGDLTNQGTQHKVGEKLTQEAANVNNLAAKNTENSKTETLKIGAEVGANVDYSGITRPAEKAIDKIAKLDILGAANDLGDIGLPNVGIDVGANGSSSDVTKNSSKALVTSVQAGSVATKTTGTVKDQGTQYEATKGGVTIEAQSHTSEAAANTETVNSRETKGNADLRVYTSTGSDISADAKGEGGTTRSEKDASNAVTGKIKAADGISIKVKEDATYQGTSLDAGAGKTSVKAGGDIKFDQATDTSSENHKGFNVKLSAKGGSTPESNNFGIGLGGGIDNGSSSASDAKVSQLAGKQGVELDSGRDLTLKGSQIGSKEQPTGDVTLKAAGKVDLQAAESTSSKENTKLSGNINVGTSSTDSKTKSGGGFNLGGDVNFEKVDESATTRQGSKIDSKGTLKIESGSDDKQAIHLQGTEVTSKATVLDAKKGGIVLESAQNEEKKNNWNLGLKGSAGISQSYDKNDKGVVDSESGKDSHNVSAGINVGVEKKDAVKQQNTKINTGNLTLNSGKDATLAGATVTADKVSGDVGGDLRVESRKDRETGVNVGVDLGLSHTNKKEDNLVTRVSDASPVGKEKIKNALETKANKAFDKVEDKYNKFAHKNDPKQDTTNAVSFSKANDKVTLPEKLVEEKTDSAVWDKGARWAGNKVKNKVVGPAEEIGLDGHFKVNANVVNNDAINETSAISGKEGVTLNVKGNTLLNGGKLSSDQGKVELKTKALELQEVKGNNYQGGGGFNLAPTVSGLLTGGAKDVLSGNTPFIQAHTKSENRDVKGGIEEGKKDDKAEETE